MAEKRTSHDDDAAARRFALITGIWIPLLPLLFMTAIDFSCVARVRYGRDYGSIPFVLVAAFAVVAGLIDTLLVLRRGIYPPRIWGVGTKLLLAAFGLWIFLVLINRSLMWSLFGIDGC